MNIITRITNCSKALVLPVAALVVSEWVFFFTKPSFMQSAGVLNSLLLLLVVLSFAVASAQLSDSFLINIDRLLSKSKILKRLSVRVAASYICWTTLILISVDNFTYTLFKRGVENTTGMMSSVYLCIIAGVGLLLFKKLCNHEVDSSFHLKMTCSSCFVAILLCLATSSQRSTSMSLHENISLKINPSGKFRPNIILFGVDGVEASHLSVYGYRRSTTPNLDKLQDELLIAENTFSNSAKTTGSITAVLTGKNPMSSKVLFPPHSLTENSSIEHLPWLLLRAGYKNIQETMRYFIDASDLGMDEAFHIINGRNGLSFLSRIFPANYYQSLYQERYFIGIIFDRVSERWQHLLQIQPMKNLYHEVVGKEGKLNGRRDSERIDRVIEFISQTKEPFFVHLHLMETHCCEYRPINPRYSLRDKNNNDTRGDDAYDDTIFESDLQFGRLIDWLKQSGKLDETLVIYFSDHGRGWTVDRRVPLVIRFPDHHIRGVLKENAQLIDILPTVTNYLGLPTPLWAEGTNLLLPLNTGLITHRPIFSIANVQTERVDRVTDHREPSFTKDLAILTQSGPPTYGATQIAMTICDRQYTLRLKDAVLTTTSIKDHTAPCFHGLPTDEMAKLMISKELKLKGFEQGPDSTSN